LVEAFVSDLVASGVPAKQGVFGADMDVQLVNKGPVTILLEG
jgi:D-Tyr-tRNAtyr deacylase